MSENDKAQERRGFSLVAYEAALVSLQSQPGFSPEQAEIVADAIGEAVNAGFQLFGDIAAKNAAESQAKLERIRKGQE